MNIKSVVIYAITITVSILFIVIGYNAFKGFRTESDSDAVRLKAKVISVDRYDETLDFYHNIVKTIYFTAEITGGFGSEYGFNVSCIQETGGAYAMQEQEVETGDSIFVAPAQNQQTGEEELRFAGYDRVSALVALCVVFLALIVFIGRTKGVSTILSLIFTCLAIFLVYVPSVLNGFNVYLSTFIVGVYIILMSLMLINGAGAKTLCAILGNIGGVILAALLALLMNKVMKMTGFVSDETMLLAVNYSYMLDVLGIVWGGMVLGSLGAIMDVAMTIASSMHELAEHMAQRSFAKMFRSGMNIGRDAIGTMTNTLILAYVGSSLALVLLMIVHSNNIIFLFSSEMIAVQVVQAITGSMGILFAVPFTAVFSAYIYCRK